MLVRDHDALRTAKAPWEVSSDVVDDRLRGLLDHARNFSLALHGAQLLYNLLLAERAERLLGWEGMDERADAQRAALGSWADELEASRPRLRAWSDRLDGFWHAVTSGGARVPPPTRDFCRSWMERALRSPAQVADADDVRQLVAARERVLKGGLAKLHSRSALESWTGRPQANDRLTYRWRNAVRIVGDIADGLGHEPT